MVCNLSTSARRSSRARSSSHASSPRSASPVSRKRTAPTRTTATVLASSDRSTRSSTPSRARKVTVASSMRTTAGMDAPPADITLRRFQGIAVRVTPCDERCVIKGSWQEGTDDGAAPPTWSACGWVRTNASSAPPRLRCRGRSCCGPRRHLASCALRRRAASGRETYEKRRRRPDRRRGHEARIGVASLERRQPDKRCNRSGSCDHRAAGMTVTHAARTRLSPRRRLRPSPAWARHRAWRMAARLLWSRCVEGNEAGCTAPATNVAARVPNREGGRETQSVARLP